MVFQKDKTGVAQTAANAAAVMVSAFQASFDSFDEAVDAYDDLRKATYAELALIVDEDNALFREVDGGSPSRGNGKAPSKSSESRSRKTGGGSKSRGGKSSITLEDALTLELNYGAFEGETLEKVLGIDAETAESDYEYGDGARDGRDYIAWLSSDMNKNEFVQRRARIVADEEGIEYNA